MTEMLPQGALVTVVHAREHWASFTASGLMLARLSGRYGRDNGQPGPVRVATNWHPAHPLCSDVLAQGERTKIGAGAHGAGGLFLSPADRIYATGIISWTTLHCDGEQAAVVIRPPMPVTRLAQTMSAVAQGGLRPLTFKRF